MLSTPIATATMSASTTTTRPSAFLQFQFRTSSTRIFSLVSKTSLMEGIGLMQSPTKFRRAVKVIIVATPTPPPTPRTASNQKIFLGNRTWLTLEGGASKVKANHVLNRWDHHRPSPRHHPPPSLYTIHPRSPWRSMSESPVSIRSVLAIRRETRRRIPGW